MYGVKWLFVSDHDLDTNYKNGEVILQQPGTAQEIHYWFSLVHRYNNNNNCCCYCDQHPCLFSATLTCSSDTSMLASSYPSTLLRMVQVLSV